MTIQQDSREKSNKKNHVLKYFLDNDIKVVRSKLFVGDYTLLNKQDVVIDLKQDIVEIAGNICGKQHERFKNECIRAKEANIKLIVLCEEMHNYKTLCLWESPLYGKYSKYAGQPITKTKGETLAKAMATMQERYGVKFMFCHREDVGRRIIEILTEGLKNG